MVVAIVTIRCEVQTASGLSPMRLVSINARAGLASNAVRMFRRLDDIDCFLRLKSALAVDDSLAKRGLVADVLGNAPSPSYSQVVRTALAEPPSWLPCHRRPCRRS